MKKINTCRPIGRLTLILLFALAIVQGCKKDSPTSQPSNPASTLSASNALFSSDNEGPVFLVSDVAKYHAANIDTRLVNSWGIAFPPNGHIWINSNGTGYAQVYDVNGNKENSIKLYHEGSPTAPSGIVFNTTGTFLLENDKPARFLFATEDGFIMGWDSAHAAKVIIDNSGSGTVYKGIEIVGKEIYAADFHNNKIDVFDSTFHPVSKSIVDPGLPAGYAPFNIRLMGDRLFVIYAVQDAARHDDEAGAGHGIIDEYQPDGTFLKRFYAHGVLNSPWGITRIKASALSDDVENKDDSKEYILVGNFGDGHINIFNGRGDFETQFSNKGKPIVIDGLWGLSYPPRNVEAYDDVKFRLYFTAGPDKENHSLFGYIRQ